MDWVQIVWDPFVWVQIFVSLLDRVEKIFPLQIAYNEKTKSLKCQIISL